MPGWTRTVVLSTILAPLFAYLAQLILLWQSPITPSVNVPLALCATEPQEDASLQHLQRVLNFKTISDVNAPMHVVDPEQFQQLWAYIQDAYPEVHSQLLVDTVGEGGLSRLYTWQGSDSAKPPVLFVAHVDVVPVPDETLPNWLHPPFAGEVADGFIWGRGAIDLKFGVVAQLEAITRLLRLGFKPTRTLLFAYGQDEEVGGKLGAGQTAELLQQRYHATRLEVVIDEGYVVLLDGLTPFTSKPVAMVATAEKGAVDLRVRVHGQGGHSSMPPRNGTSTVEVMGRLIAAVSQRKLPLRLTPPLVAFFHTLAEMAPMWAKPLLMHADKWPLSWLLANVLAASSQELSANVRSTVIPTIIHAGQAANVLPASGEINFNCRVLPGDTAESMVAHVQAAARSLGLGSQVEVVGTHDMAFHIHQAMSDADGPHFALLKRAIQESWRFGDEVIPVVPSLLTGGTDSKHYALQSRGGVLRFLPVGLNRSAGEAATIHAANERSRVDSLYTAICCYTRMAELFAAL